MPPARHSPRRIVEELPEHSEHSYSDCSGSDTPSALRMHSECSGEELEWSGWNLGIASPSSSICKENLDRFREVSVTYDVTLTQEAQERIPTSNSFYGVHSQLDNVVFKMLHEPRGGD